MEYALVNVILGDIIDEGENPGAVKKIIKKIVRNTV